MNSCNVQIENKNITNEEIKSNLTHQSISFDKNIRSIFQDSKGTYWFGTNSAGVFRLSGQELTQFTVKNGLAANQVLRHRMADMSVHCEVARSMALRAALHVDHADVSVRARAVSGAWAKVIRAARSVTEEAIQMHGGMGVTDELNIGLFLKRVLALEALVGSADHHLRRHAAHSARSMANV